jgi:hypothetical protein
MLAQKMDFNKSLSYSKLSQLASLCSLGSIIYISLQIPFVTGKVRHGHPASPINAANPQYEE